MPGVQRGLIHSLDLCVPQPWPSYNSCCLTWYRVITTDLAGLSSPPPIMFSNKSYQLEKLLALPLHFNLAFESSVQLPRVAASCLATSESFHEDPTWLVMAACLEGLLPWTPTALAWLQLCPT